MNQDFRLTEPKHPAQPDTSTLSCVFTVRLTTSEAHRVIRAAGDARQTISAFGRKAFAAAAGDRGTGADP